MSIKMDTRKQLWISAIFIVVLVSGVTAGLLITTPHIFNEDTVTVTDSDGRVVPIPTQVDTIASNYPISTSAILFLGGADMLIAVDSSTLSTSFMLNLYPSLSDATDIGYPWTVNMEQIVALDPDIFFTAWNSEIADQLQEKGIPTVCLNFESPEEFNRALTIIGNCLGLQTAAANAVDYYQTKEKDLELQTKTLAKSARPKILFMSYGARRMTVFQVPGKGMLQNELISLAGGVSVSEDLPGGWSEVSVEQAAVWNPDIIIITSYSSETTATDLKNQVLDDAAWDITTAAQNSAVYAFPGDWESWDAPTPKWILGLYWLATVIQPDMFSDINFQSIATEFYQDFYGVTWSTAGVTGDI
ncbi:ABC transporter substrate-binding protein [Candidatus Borrarchaeum sp.]|uniref:ABC transporter substrate-binding protein n=1 Tax=Candidatus Borrarchaeum sp. TaxID=2846742 RepID=UPI00257D83D1|nr:ABC transporter substrate-binding protein [Candidatus Borrarchaeum sp.]